MKRLAFIIGLVLIITSCGSSEPQKTPYKFELGQIVHFKIDNTSCIIVDRYVWEGNNRYEVKYRGEENRYDNTYVSEYELKR